MERAIDPLLTIDAKLWADEFMATKQRLGDAEFDHAMMLGWFANAIMQGYDEGQRRAKADTQATVEALQRERDEAIREHGKESGFWGRTCARLLDKRDKLQAALDAEREKMRVLEVALKKVAHMPVDGNGQVYYWEGRDLAKAALGQPVSETYTTMHQQLSQLQALVSGMKSIIPHQHCRTCNQYADELRNYDIWGKRTLDATTPAWRYT